MTDEEARTHEPTVLIMDAKNCVKEIIREKQGMTI